MRSWLFIPFVIIFLIACKSKDRIPAGVLSQQKMQAVLWDVLRADEFLYNYVLNKDSAIDKVKESLKYYEQIFVFHKVTKEEFQESFSFYQDHPMLFKSIMDSISRAPLVAPTQIVAPTEVVQPVPALDTTSTLQKFKRDTVPVLRKKKGLPVQ